MWCSAIAERLLPPEREGSIRLELRAIEALINGHAELGRPAIAANHAALPDHVDAKQEIDPVAAVEVGAVCTGPTISGSMPLMSSCVCAARKKQKRLAL